VRKAFAVGCIVFVLGAQAWTILPPGGRPRMRHWPFLDYPMYSAAHHVGDSIALDELRAVHCGAPDSAQPVPASALRLELGRYWQMLHRLSSSPAPAPLLDTLARLTRSFVGTDVCALQVWRQVLVVEPRGVRGEDHPWVNFGEWTIPPGSSEPTPAPAPR
jgi:hypothetical protein